MCNQTLTPLSAGDWLENWSLPPVMNPAAGQTKATNSFALFLIRLEQNAKQRESKQTARKPNLHWWSSRHSLQSPWFKCELWGFTIQGMEGEGTREGRERGRKEGRKEERWMDGGRGGLLWVWRQKTAKNSGHTKHVQTRKEDTILSQKGKIEGGLTHTHTLPTFQPRSCFLHSLMDNDVLKERKQQNVIT